MDFSFLYAQVHWAVAVISLLSLEVDEDSLMCMVKKTTGDRISGTSFVFLRLGILHPWHCYSTRKALIAIGKYSMTIETVDVGWCKEITDQGATQIAQSSKSLRYLGLMRCDKVNEITVEQLVQQHPHITFSTVLQDCKRTLERAYQMGWTPNMSTAS
ncbi:hypothetical protein JRQ81_013659 [Phrynocephalus forsythii]|uniref:F-box/LRR-repeat protein 17 n=1 Tax=Phrynocephalus forsythii TaxID=171643 RepID=A0A9Q1B488_9SAUR|nr:hypothetical protein JRQ81_013659 [Phrynocephalus forsythii]